MALIRSYKHTFFASYAGYFVQAIINNFIPLLFLTFQKSFGFSYDKISLLIVINFGVQLLVDLSSAPFIDKIGYRKCIVAAHVCASVGLAGLGVFPFIMEPYIGIILCIFIYAVGSGLIEVIVSPLVEACPSEKKAASMSLLHSFYCWGQMSVVAFSTLFFVLLGIENWRFLAFLWALVPFFNGIYFTLVPVPEVLNQGKGMKICQILSSKLFYAFALIMLCSGASELAMSQWASTFAESGLKVSKTIGDLLGPCLFAALMGTARVLYSRLTERISLSKVMVMSSVLCIVSYLTAALSPVAIVSLLGCALCGFSVGVMWPGAFSMASEKIPLGGTAMFALLALFGDLGCASGPALAGRIAAVTDGNLNYGILAATVFPFLLIVGVWLQNRKRV